MAPAWSTALGFTLFPHIGGFLGSFITRKEIPTWYKSLKKPAWRPPNWMFAPVWATLYAGMGYGSYLVWKDVGGFTQKAVVPLGLYGGQLALNWIWTPLFFGAHKPGLAFIDIVFLYGAVVATTVKWYPINRKAAYLMMPYLAWLTVAAVLNFHIWKDNRKQNDE
ncbi:translocator protein [Latimeria chalumnae]|uniref:Translocator protein n=1 Tax=Latimeria chalumnae TaxID=7897 RepID=H3BBR3_LATCH|nr:PREDICTED: translocator protein [Latimeria chalumnae]XP_014342546.1 PREDICTED: translocator protein [Latimeria chalumnae]XP_014342547.1 PREDICTED: translocator protein [Latimeria chalumnae]|eukprot:XP_005993740.1 PREDICTED: translocator protein [Latimeria chalumnae]